ncbi:MAG: HIT family protein [Candidatus Promineifilaceae bacterium]
MPAIEQPLPGQRFERRFQSAAEVEAYIQGSQSGPCFICAMLAVGADNPHHIIYADEAAVVFLNKYPTLYGYTLVAPRLHREQVSGDFSPEEYLHLQRLIYRVAEAIRQTVPTERLYILSLGSQQGNRHVHWHLAPLPPGVPYHEQQLEALHPAAAGILQIPQEEMAALTGRLRRALEGISG